MTEWPQVIGRYATREKALRALRFHVVEGSQWRWRVCFDPDARYPLYPWTLQVRPYWIPWKEEDDNGE